ncbi:hypothetical protein UM396_14380 [Geobacillus subterraneus]|uniref:hypothetical protein n=1 Tax=Geobacillus subterraneus TaxID=129338 RepID=UPI002AC9E95A|nr:hypothetical protein [Geobacillus subterraneus]WPZ17768.1 hypothetical protein UM396_14380 [Geobacillus subterraneus]
MNLKWVSTETLKLLMQDAIIRAQTSSGNVDYILKQEQFAAAIKEELELRGIQTFTGR